MAGLEPVTSTVTGWHSNQLSYIPAIICDTLIYTSVKNCQVPLRKNFYFFYRSCTLKSTRNLCDGNYFTPDLKKCKPEK